MDIALAMTVFVVVGVLLSLAVTLVAIWEYPTSMSLTVAVLTGGAAIWAFPFAVAFHTPDLNHHLILQRIRYIGTVLVPLAYYVVAVRYAGYRQFARQGVVLLLAIIPALTLVLVWTSSYHTLFWETITVQEIGGVWTSSFVYGPWFAIHLLWVYSLILFALVLLFRASVEEDTRNRTQTLAIFCGGLLPFALSAAYFGGLWQIDLTPIGIGIGGAIIGVGLLLLDLVEIRPIARDRLIEQLDDGVIVLDREGQIQDINPVAKQILGDLGVESRIESSIPEHLKIDGETVESFRDGEERSYQIDVHIFFEPTGEEVGEIIYFNDITEIARREQRISVLHRVLRHNIRNEMTVLLGHLDYAQRDADRSVIDDLLAVERSAERIMNFAENARLIERTLKQKEQTGPIDITECVQSAIAGAPQGDVSFSTEKTDETAWWVSGVDRQLLRRAIGELIENALIHGAGAVEVRIRSEEQWVVIEVLDEGPGIPEAEIEALHAPVETALEHGSGLGLWVARWAAELSAGELTFGTDHDTNVVTMRLPAADEPS